MDVRVIVKTMFNQAHLLCSVAEELEKDPDLGVYISGAVDEMDCDGLDFIIRLKREAKNLRSMINNPTTKEIKKWIDGGASVTKGVEKPVDMTDFTTSRNYIAGALGELGMKVNFGWLTTLCRNYSVGGSYGPLIQAIDDFCTRAMDPGFEKDKIAPAYIGAVIKNNVGTFREESKDGPTCAQCQSPSVPHEKHGDKWSYRCSKGHEFYDH